MNLDLALGIFCAFLMAAMYLAPHLIWVWVALGMTACVVSYVVARVRK